MGQMRNACNVLARKLEVRRYLGRYRRRWESYIKINIQEMRVLGCGVDSSGSGRGPRAASCEGVYLSNCEPHKNSSVPWNW
jgi:hypothetical protein